MKKLLLFYCDYLNNNRSFNQADTKSMLCWLQFLSQQGAGSTEASLQKYHTYLIFHKAVKN